MKSDYYILPYKGDIQKPMFSSSLKELLNPPQHEGPVSIQLLQPHHSESLLEYKTTNRDFLQPFSPKFQDEHFTLQFQHQIIQSALREAVADQAYRFGVFLQTDGQWIGQINLTGVIRGPFQNALLGYSIDYRYKGLGYMSEAVRLCMHLAFNQLQLHRVQAAVMPHNIGSIRVLQKNRFTEEGYARNYLRINGKWEDHLLFALLQETYDDPICIKDIGAR
ncbi:MAG: yjcK [Paenibacillus sp.]|jgi:ribosomal-protein-alanine N-acetyltransferase|nr:yjcK [Paenibacillus sp.]